MRSGTLFLYACIQRPMVPNGAVRYHNRTSFDISHTVSIVFSPLHESLIASGQDKSHFYSKRLHSSILDVCLSKTSRHFFHPHFVLFTQVARLNTGHPLEQRNSNHIIPKFKRASRRHHKRRLHIPPRKKSPGLEKRTSCTFLTTKKRTKTEKTERR